MRVSLLTLAVAVVLTGTACGPDETPTAFFRLRFDGIERCSHPSVRVGQVAVTVPGFGERRTSCSGSVTVSFPNLPPGTYDVSFQAFDEVDPSFVAFATRQQIVHTRDGTHSYEINLLPTTEVVPEWLIAAGPNDEGLTCAEADVSRITLEYAATNGSGTKSYEAPCLSNGFQATSIRNLDPGFYDVTIRAFDPTNRELYASVFKSQQVLSGSNSFPGYVLLPSVGAGLELSFLFQVGHQATDRCNTAGVGDLEIRLIDPYGATLFYEFDCSTNPMLRFRWDRAQEAFEAGIYTLQFARAFAPNGDFALYELRNQRIFVPAGRNIGWELTLR